MQAGVEYQYYYEVDGVERYDFMAKTASVVLMFEGSAPYKITANVLTIPVSASVSAAGSSSSQDLEETASMSCGGSSTDGSLHHHSHHHHYPESGFECYPIVSWPKSAHCSPQKDEFTSFKDSKQQSALKPMIIKPFMIISTIHAVKEAFNNNNESTCAFNFAAAE
jgi:hypothetical protein